MRKVETNPSTHAHVLLVDQDSANLENMGHVLRREGFRVTLARGMHPAMDAIENDCPDLVLTELHMPDGSGLELKLTLERRDPLLPFVVLSKDNSRESMLCAVRCRAFDYLSKPVNPAQLVAVTQRAVLERRSAKAQSLHRDQLRRQHQLRSEVLSVLFEKSSEAVMVWDEHGRLQDMSQSAAQLFGENSMQLLCRPLDDLFEEHPIEGPLSKVLRRLIEEPDVHSQWRSTVHIRRDRNEMALPAQMSLSICEFEDHAERGSGTENRPRYIIGLIAVDPAHDERGRQLKQTDRLANSAILAGSAAHEIKNDLGPLVGYFSLLEFGEMPNARMIEMMQQSVRRIQSQLEQLLNPLRPRPRAAARRIPLHLAVSDTLEHLRRSGSLRRIQLEWEDPAELDSSITVFIPSGEQDPKELMVMASPDDLHQIVMNLVTNACDALTPEQATKGMRGTIALRVWGENEYAVMEVQDNGAGIPPEHRNRVFEDFFTTKGHEGTGLGLPVVHEILRNLRGHLRLDSTPGRGTTVQVRLPLAPPQSASSVH